MTDIEREILRLLLIEHMPKADIATELNMAEADVAAALRDMGFVPVSDEARL